MPVISWIIAAFLLGNAASQDDTYTSLNRPDYYNGEEGTVLCSFTVPADALGAVTGFGLTLDSPEQSKTLRRDFCRITKSPDGTEVTSSLSLSDADCTAAYTKLEREGTTTLSIPVEITETGEYRCSRWTTSEYIQNDILMNVKVLFEAPTSLSMVFSPEKVYAGDELTVLCKSEGGDPLAVFEYSINGDLVGGVVTPFIVSRQDHESVYGCTDTSHSNFNGGESELTMRRRKLQVYYFSATKPEVAEMMVNPSLTERLSCTTNHNLPTNVVVEYEWTKDGMRLEGANNSDLMIEQNKQLNETMKEVYNCTARTNDPKLGEVTLTFNVIWDVETTTPRPTVPPATKTMKKPIVQVTTPEPTNSPTTVIIIIVVVIVVIGIIVIVTIIIVKRRKSGEMSGLKEPAEKHKDAEKGKEEEASAEKLLPSKPTENSEEDPARLS